MYQVYPLHPNFCRLWVLWHGRLLARRRGRLAHRPAPAAASASRRRAAAPRGPRLRPRLPAAAQPLMVATSLRVRRQLPRRTRCRHDAHGARARVSPCLALCVSLSVTISSSHRCEVPRPAGQPPRRIIDVVPFSYTLTVALPLTLTLALTLTLTLSLSRCPSRTSSTCWS